MYATYRDCINLTGSPVCGNIVNNMSSTYNGCTNLTGPAIIGPNVTNASDAYANCYNISSNIYIYSNKVRSLSDAFSGVINGSRRFNIYVPKTGPNSSYNTCNSIINGYCYLAGSWISFTSDMTTNGYYYNAALNLYVYPVSNVAQARMNNGD
jgi:hypothetical protein